MMPVPSIERAVVEATELIGFAPDDCAYRGLGRYDVEESTTGVAGVCVEHELRLLNLRERLHHRRCGGSCISGEIVGRAATSASHQHDHEGWSEESNETSTSHGPQVTWARFAVA